MSDLKNSIAATKRPAANLSGFIELVNNSDCEELAEILRTVFYDFARFSYLISDRGLVVPSEIETQLYALREVIEAVECAAKP